MPASRAIAIATAAALVAGEPAGDVRSPRAGPACRSSATPRSSSCCATTPRRSCKAAGLAQQNVQVVLINERAFNAFVMDGRRIFINVGALYNAKTPNEIIGVLAHETGHMSGGHLSRLREQMANAQTASIIAMLLGVGAMVGGRHGRRVDGSQHGADRACDDSGPQEMIRRSLLSYVRAQEEAADRAGVKFLNATSSPRRACTDLQALRRRPAWSFPRASIPTSSRIRCRASAWRAWKTWSRPVRYWDKADPPELQLRHDMMRAKLAGFLERPDSVARRYPSTDTSLPARYARAISAYRFAAICRVRWRRSTR